SLCLLAFFSFHDTAPHAFYTLSLHDALPIWHRLDGVEELADVDALLLELAPGLVGDEAEGELRERVGDADVDVGRLAVLLRGVDLDPHEAGAAVRRVGLAGRQRVGRRRGIGRLRRPGRLGGAPRRQRQGLGGRRPQRLQQGRGLLHVQLARGEHVEYALALVRAGHSAPPRLAHVEVAGRNAHVETRGARTEGPGEGTSQP